ncbi:hypothetical protein Tco_0814336 [Tanacetum coccineum]
MQCKNCIQQTTKRRNISSHLGSSQLSPCYPVFVITAEVLEIYMHQFWTTIKKIGNSDAYNFKLEKKKFRVDTEVFREILQICPRILNQDFIAPPSEEELVTFIQELGYSGRCNMLSAIHTDQMHQPWRTFAAIINRCISGKTTRLDRLRESRAQILCARKEHIPYPRFTKVIINHFISKDKTISMRNKINLHTIRDDSLLGTLKFVSKAQDYQQYEALIPDDMINQDIKDSIAYKTYYDFATGKVPPRKARKYKKVASPSIKLSPVKEAETVKKAKRVKRPAKKSTTAPTTSVVIRDTLGVSVSKKKAPAMADTSKGVPGEQQCKTFGTDEGTCNIPGVLDVPKYQYENDDESWGDSEDDNDDDSEDDNDDNNDDDSKGDDDKADGDDDGNSDDNDDERADSDDDDENPSFTLKDYDEEVPDEEYESDDDNENVFEEEDDDLYKDVDVRSLGAEREKERKGDEEITDANQNVSQEQSYKQVIEDAHVTLTASLKTDDSKQSSSVSSDFANQFFILEKTPPSDHEVASLMNIKMGHKVPNTHISSPLTKTATVIPDSSTIASTTIPPIISMISPLPQLTTPTPAPTTTSTTTSILALPDFSSLFGFDQRVSTLEMELSQLKQANLSAQLLESVKSQLPTMVDDLLSTRIGYATRTAL